MRPTYNNETQEPTVLPAEFPNLLVNGSAGIAVGLATNIPPHNLGETVRAAVHLIDNPAAETADLLRFVKGPDFPTGGKVLVDKAELRRIYEKGDGSVRVQCEWKQEEKNRRHYLVVTSIPYGVDRGALERAIGEIIEDRKLPQVIGLANESNEKDGCRLVLEVKPGTDPNVVLAYLFKHTDLQKSFAYNLTCLVPPEQPGQPPQPRRLGLRDLLRYFLDFRFATVRKRFQYELDKLRRRIHILEGFRFIFNALDRALKLIRESDGKADAARKLIETFGIDAEQADAVLDAQIYKLAQLEIKAILRELEEKAAEAKRIQTILDSEVRLWAVIKEELTALAEKHRSPRRTRMASEEDAPEFDPEAYIVRENTNVVLTRDGWLKRVGRLASVEGTRVREGDEVAAVVPASTIDHVVLLADDGTAYTMRANEVPAGGGYGEPVSKFFKLADRVRIIGVATTDERFLTAGPPPADKDTPAGPYLFVVTSAGQVLRTPLAAFRTASTKSGRRYVGLGENDKVVLAAVPADESAVLLASSAGRAVHFALTDVPILAGAGKGVMGMRLEEGEACVGGALVGKRGGRMVVETTAGKTTELRAASVDLTARGGRGVEFIKRGTPARVHLPAIELPDWDAVEGRDPKPSREPKDPPRNGTSHPSLFT
jgi:DNA gyrase subunit A